ncbi:MAG: hypothetical protein WDW19_05840 [Neisseriaceae bacterium]
MSKQANRNLFNLNWDVEVSTAYGTESRGLSDATIALCTQLECVFTQITQCH